VIAKVHAFAAADHLVCPSLRICRRGKPCLPFHQLSRLIATDMQRTVTIRWADWYRPASARSQRETASEMSSTLRRRHRKREPLVVGERLSPSTSCRSAPRSRSSTRASLEHTVELQLHVASYVPRPTSGSDPWRIPHQHDLTVRRRRACTASHVGGICAPDSRLVSPCRPLRCVVRDIDAVDSPSS